MLEYKYIDIEVYQWITEHQLWSIYLISVFKPISVFVRITSHFATDEVKSII